MKINYLVALLAFVTACQAPADKDDEDTHSQHPPNIILLVGDGMGVAQLSSLYYFKNEEIHMDRFDVTGLSKTSSAKQKITDSGASGTALSSGTKTYNGAIGVDIDTSNVKNIVELLSEQDYTTGIISTSSITHATPASFFAHSASRNDEDFIASQLHESQIDFFAGGGLKHFNKRKDQNNYIDSLRQHGFEIDTTQLSSSLAQIEGKKLGFLLEDGALPKKIDGRGDFLPSATALAAEFLNQKKAPFFLMVEGSQIDWGGHENNHDYLVGEMIDFDNAIGKALDFAQEHKNTIVIVTADHETGGYALRSGENSEGNTDYDKVAPSFSTHGHTAAIVPVLAFGPQANTFTGIYENTEIFNKLINLTQ